MVEKPSTIQIVIADDHTIFRDGLRTMIAREDGLEVVGEASDGEQALRAVQNLDPDILLLDFAMPKVSGLEVLGLLKGTAFKTKTIMLSGVMEGEDIFRAFELGALGVVLKDTATSFLFKSIQAVTSGRYWFGQKSVETLEEILHQPRNAAPKADPKKYGLTRREMEIIEAVVSGSPNRKIARELSISEQTVKHHITNIFDKLGIYNRLELTLFVFHHGLLKTAKK